MAPLELGYPSMGRGGKKSLNQDRKRTVRRDRILWNTAVLQRGKEDLQENAHDSRRYAVPGPDWFRKKRENRRKLPTSPKAQGIIWTVW